MLPSKTSTSRSNSRRHALTLGRLGGACGVLLLLLFAWGCKPKPTAIAELTKADGPVERQAGQGAWGAATIGTKYFLGDAARTADAPAQLSLAGGRAVIKMDKFTTLRFGGARGGAAKIGVELGAITLVGAGNFGLDVGNVKVEDNGEIRIVAKGQGKSSVELLVGTAQISGVDGQMVELQIGQILELGVGPIKVEAVTDAGVDAAPIDAADTTAPVAQDGTIEVKGPKGEILPPGATKWEKLAAGAAVPLTKGSKVRLGPGTTATLVANGVTLSMAGGSRTAVGDDLAFGLELGSATGSVGVNAEGNVGVPGGKVGIKGSATGGGKARLDVNKNGDTKIAVLEGSANLTGASGADLAMKTGESASLAKAGGIKQTAKIPDYYDMRVSIGEGSFTIHDTKGATALQFFFNGKCNGGTVEMDNDPKFKTARISAGKDSANMLADGVGAYYRLVCANGSVAGSGRISIRHDAGTRPLPKDPPVNPIDPDGRNYTISYQSVIPNLKIKAPAGGSSYKVHMATGGADQVFDSTKPDIKVEGKSLKEATYTMFIEKDGAKVGKPTTVTISFDQQAPQVYIESPQNNKPFGAEVDVRGAVLPGWTAKVLDVEIPIDARTRRFSAKVPPPTGALALAIRLSHPQRGVHYYLRRGAK
ncbi:MAG TPA: hypothetical protein VMZ53_21975 [Kofleriaceae bacterium]|nr:hypothetical protein [Kofleriaceae bacterium]